MLSARKMSQLVELCVKISERTKADTFFRYNPHVDGFDIDVHYDGWVPDRYPDVCISSGKWGKCTITYPRGDWKTEYASMNEIMDCLKGLLASGVKNKAVTV